MKILKYLTIYLNQSNLIPKKRSNKEIHGNETIENLKNSVINVNAEIMAFKRFIKDEIYYLS